MELEESLVSEKVRLLEALVGGTFPATLSKLVSSSREIPATKDFHFFYNFNEFKCTTDEILRSSQSVLETIGDSVHVWGKPMGFEGDVDGNDAYDWLVNVNDEILERFDDSIDEFERTRKREEGAATLGSVVDNSENGVQLVSVTKRNTDTMGGGSEIDVKGSERDAELSKQGKAKVSFHLATIKKPQDEFNILVNNSNLPFEHVWLERSEESLQYIHPLEKLSLMDFVDKNIREMKPVKPLPLEGTPFKLIEEVEDLKDLAAKLHSVEEFAVDLEHNQYRSFQGLTCLIQISTRTEDFVVDTFKLWVHIGPYLRDIFKDPKKKKVMHGADRDIIWLQRDFGIYVCNLFDTGQASRVLKLERNSLEFLLKHYCGVTANKQYQNADWRVRPLPDVMIRYAREDTHYLLYIYDLMRLELETMEREGEQSDSLLTEVYRRSYDVCMQLYEKDLLTGNSYLHVHGLQAASFNAVQLAIVAGLCEWRDAIARAEDESTGYVLPNKQLFDIAEEMPINVGKLRRVLKSKLPYIERNIDSVVIVIRKSMQNAAAFESAVQSLKEWRPGTKFGKNKQPTTEETDAKDVASPSLKKSLQVESDMRGISINLANNDEARGLGTGLFGSGKVSADIAKKPSSGLGALKRKSESDNKLEVKEEIKHEEIRSPVSQPFTNKVSKPKSATSGASVSKPNEVIIVLDDESDEESSESDNPSDRVTETPFEEPVTQNQKVSGSSSKTVDVIVLDDDESDDESGTSTSSCNSEAMGEKQKRFIRLKPGFLNKTFGNEPRR